MPTLLGEMATPWIVGLGEIFKVKIMTRLTCIPMRNVILKLVCFLQLFNLSTRSWLNRNVSLHGNIHGKNIKNNKVAQKIFSNFQNLT